MNMDITNNYVSFEMAKHLTEFLLNEFEKIYPGIIEAAKYLDENEIKSYIDFCNNAPKNCSKDINTWKVYEELKNKCLKKGLKSIIQRKDVLNVSKKYVPSEGPNCPEHTYIVVETIYGTFKY